ncbi:MAG TPA: hypothetical protein VF211_02895 [Burkholderiales bacterium]
MQRRGVAALAAVLAALAVVYSAPSFAEPFAGRGYLMKGKLAGGPSVFDDVVASFALGARLGRDWHADLLYKNEGHADEGHRDGFGVALMRRIPIAGRLSAELGGGLLWTFNTVRRDDGDEANEKRGALVASAALLYRFDPTFSLRAQLDRVIAPGSFSTSTLLLGLQADFERREAGAAAGGSSPAARGVEAALFAGAAMMNTGEARASFAFGAEARRHFGADFACSASVLRENDNRLVSRESAALQCWYVRAVSETWRIGAGAGPALVFMHSDDGDTTRLGAMLSLEASKRVSDSLEAGLRFSRLAVPHPSARDADLFLLFARRAF